MFSGTQMFGADTAAARLSQMFSYFCFKIVGFRGPSSWSFSSSGSTVSPLRRARLWSTAQHTTTSVMKAGFTSKALKKIEHQRVFSMPKGRSTMLLAQECLLLKRACTGFCKVLCIGWWSRWVHSGKDSLNVPFPSMIRFQSDWSNEGRDGRRRWTWWVVSCIRIKLQKWHSCVEMEVGCGVHRL